jgi:hypothetical protein
MLLLDPNDWGDDGLVVPAKIPTCANDTTLNTLIDLNALQRQAVFVSWALLWTIIDWSLTFFDKPSRSCRCVTNKLVDGCVLAQTVARRTLQSANELISVWQWAPAMRRFPHVLSLMTPFNCWVVIAATAVWNSNNSSNQKFKSVPTIPHSKPQLTWMLSKGKQFLWVGLYYGQ